MEEREGEEAMTNSNNDPEFLENCAEMEEMTTAAIKAQGLTPIRIKECSICFSRFTNGVCRWCGPVEGIESVVARRKKCLK